MVETACAFLHDMASTRVAITSVDHMPKRSPSVDIADATRSAPAPRRHTRLLHSSPTAPAHSANTIEPSVEGGDRIARAIMEVLR
jgi:hypothetical protein